jgi:hypothetical protein
MQCCALPLSSSERKGPIARKARALKTIEYQHMNKDEIFHAQLTSSWFQQRPRTTTLLLFRMLATCAILWDKKM